MIENLLKALELKDEKRTGWELRQVTDPESVADHSWGTAFLCLLYAEEDINTARAVKMALVHDLAEAEIGDIPKRAVDTKNEFTEEEKEQMEEKAMEKLSTELKDSLEELWREYEDRETSEAKFVKDMDMVELCLQALKYEKEDRYDKDAENSNFQRYERMDEFFATTEPLFTTETGRELFEEIKDRYEKTKQE